MERTNRKATHGFSLIELLIVSAVLLIVLGGVMSYITVASQRSKVEQTQVDLAQEGRSFVDEFERDIHQAGYPGCRMFNFSSNCSAHFNDSTVAVGLVSVDYRQLVFEADVDGNGSVDSIWYRLVDSAGNYPPTGTFPCTIQRGQVVKANGTAPLSQAPIFSQALQNVVNSGSPGAGSLYGNGLTIAGNVLFGGGTQTNDSFYAAVTTFKDFPVFSAYDQYGNAVSLPVDITTPAGQQALGTPGASASSTAIKSIRLTINLLGSATSGYDPRTGVRPTVTLVGNGRLNN